MKFFIRLTTKQQKIEFNEPLDMHIRDLKDKIYSQDLIGIDYSIKLIFRGHILKDNDTLESSNLKEGNTLLLFANKISEQPVSNTENTENTDPFSDINPIPNNNAISPLLQQLGSPNIFQIHNNVLTQIGTALNNIMENAFQPTAMDIEPTEESPSNIPLPDIESDSLENIANSEEPQSEVPSVPAPAPAPASIQIPSQILGIINGLTGLNNANANANANPNANANAVEENTLSFWDQIRNTYATQLETLRNMGFTNDVQNLQYLMLTSGDVNRTINYLLN